MNHTFLDNIVAAKRKRLAALSTNKSFYMNAFNTEQSLNNHVSASFYNSITDPARSGIIAEFKRASPSKGTINKDLLPENAAIAYENAGAAAISVLTEEDYFSGSLSDLIAVRKATNLPVLRKDFIIDEIQIHESAAAGANAILLIAALLSTEKLLKFREAGETLGIDSIVEVHNEEDMKSAIDSGARIIGVNNRDLRTFEVSLDVSRRLIKHRPSSVVMVAESGIASPKDILELRALGYQSFLIGEAFMRSAEPENVLKSFIENASGNIRNQD